MALDLRTTTRINRSLSQIGVAGEQVLRQDANRLAVTIVNLSAATFYLSPDRVPSATHGIRVGPSGGILVLNWREDLHLVGYEWWGLSTVAASDIFIIETVSLSPDVSLADVVNFWLSGVLE
jgi:hypothetical protein